MSVRKVLAAPNQKLYSKSRKLKDPEIKSTKIKTLISDIYDTLKAGEYGVGMSAIQVGEPLAVSVVMIRPTPNRPDLGYFNQVYFNPEIVETFGEKEPMWEGCCSVRDSRNAPVYAKVPRYKKIKITYSDESCRRNTETVNGFLAHVLQHEIDHINGVIFTDLVQPADIVSQEQYRKMLKLKNDRN